MARGPGVSYDELPNGRWRVRWRETVEEDGQRKRVQRSKVVDSQAAAIKVQREVLDCLELGQLYEREPVRVIPRVATVDAVLDGWLSAQEARGTSSGALEVYDSSVARVLAGLREVGRVSPTEQVPGDLLSREGVVALTSWLRAEDFAESTIHGTIRALLAAWSWASDDPKVYPGLEPAPRDTSPLLPQAVLYQAARAPTLAECDAVIRRLMALRHSTISRHVAVIMRCTGLRVNQVLGMQVRDVMLESGRLYVRTGKSRREKAGREVPLAPVLVPYLEALLGVRAAEPTAPLIPRRSDATRRIPKRPDGTFHAVWQAATEAGEVDGEVWAPEAHDKARPTHAFRAAYQAHLVGAGVRDKVIDYLVGCPSDTRDRHYAGREERWASMVEAVSHIPPIAWTTPAAAACAAPEDPAAPRAPEALAEPSGWRRREL